MLCPFNGQQLTVAGQRSGDGVLWSRPPEPTVSTEPTTSGWGAYTDGIYCLRLVCLLSPYIRLGSHWQVSLQAKGSCPHKPCRSRSRMIDLCGREEINIGRHQNSLPLTTNFSQNVTELSKGISYRFNALYRRFTKITGSSAYTLHRNPQQMAQMAFCDLSHTFHKQTTIVFQHVFVIQLFGILTSPVLYWG